MNTYRPINTGEGEITLVPGISCASPFDKLKICDCGAITFLDGPCRICGKKAFRKAYSYTADAEDVRQTGELTVIKHKKRFYAVYVVSRAEDAGKNDSLIADIYEKMTLV